MLACGVCAWDSYLYQGMSLMGEQHPFQFGHEGVGIVKEVGAGVQGFTPGDKVFCAGGGRSVYAVKALQDMGFTNVAHLASGFGGWQGAGEPIHNYAESSRWVRRESDQA